MAKAPLTGKWREPRRLKDPGRPRILHTVPVGTGTKGNNTRVPDRRGSSRHPRRGPLHPTKRVDAESDPRMRTNLQESGGVQTGGDH